MKNTSTTEIVHSISNIKDKIRFFKKKGAVIGLVPTMGALHKGHESLLKTAKTDCDIVITSIFVNPTQFCPGEDFDKYPRQLEEDRDICLKHGIDIIFAPSVTEMYPDNNYTEVVPPEFYQNKLCGKWRKGHFNGVATIVVKLFNITTPDRAYFGQKDAQQLAIIQKITEDLNLPIKIIPCPTVREPDGLAFSSRNQYLNDADRQKAVCLYKALKSIKEQYDMGMECSSTAINQARKHLVNGTETEYFTAVDSRNLEPAPKLQKGVLIALAVKIGGVRLIDNLII